MPLYTRTGDAGETALFDGTRVSKSVPRVAAYGEVDELSAVIGLALATPLEEDLAAVLVDVQRDLFALGAQLADPRHRVADRVSKVRVGAVEVERLESAIDRFDAQVPPLRRFILPGGEASGATLHLARAVCRRAERAIVALGPDEVPADVVRYVNRLSDLLFVMARLAGHRRGHPEREW